MNNEEAKLIFTLRSGDFVYDITKDLDPQWVLPLYHPKKYCYAITPITSRAKDKVHWYHLVIIERKALLWFKLQIEVIMVKDVLKAFEDDLEVDPNDGKKVLVVGALQAPKKLTNPSLEVSYD